MNTRYFVLAALLVSTGWSSQVAYKSHLAQIESKAFVSRSIASQLDELNMSNIKDESIEIRELAKELKSSKEDLIEELKAKTLKEIAKGSREKKIKEIEDIRNQIRDRLSKAELFVTKIERNVQPEPKGDGEASVAEETFQESDVIDDPLESPEKDAQLISEVSKSLQDSRAIVDEFNIVDFKIILDEAIEVAMQEKIVEQEKSLSDLNSRICSQNEKIDSLTTKLEKLLEDKEKVVDELDEDELKDKKKKEAEMSLASLFNPALFMSPSQFFSQGLFANQQNTGPDYSFLNSSPQMGGMDMNFLMLTSLLGQNTGIGALGGRTNITYSPVYYNNQGYTVPTSLSNHGSGDFSFHNGQMGIPSQTMQQFPSFPRSNALQTNNAVGVQSMDILPNSQLL